MSSDAARSLDLVMRYLRQEFALGQDSISKHDVVEDGRALDEAVSDVLEAVAAGHTGLDPDEVAALEVMADAWGGGFELASGDDFFDGDRTIRELAEVYVPQAFPTGPGA